jgi:hypothetical protein
MGTHKKNKIKFNKEDLEIAVKNSKTYVEVFRFLKLCPTNYGFLKKKLSLILDHINGDRYDNRIENLRIICPNCNAALETHCGKNKKGNINLQKEIETASKINQNKIKLESIKNKILNSNIDFTKHGWRIHLGKFMDLSPQHCGKYIKKHLPEIWEKCAKHKN